MESIEIDPSSLKTSPPILFSPVEDMDSDNELDISWIQPHEKENNIDKNILREPQETIPLYFIYLNKNDYIEHIFTEKQSLLSIDEKRVISKERVLHIIQTKRHFNNKKYKFIDLFSYNIVLEPENIQPFIKNDNSKQISKEFLKVLPFFNEIIISDSIFIFHSINSVYFLFKENNKNNKKEFKRLLKPILKKADKTKKMVDDLIAPHNITKKVLFTEEETPNDSTMSLPSDIPHNKTKKQVFEKLE